jgi:GDP-L-fucose synthase
MSPPLLFDPTDRRIFVAGHTGMVGSALVRRLSREPCTILTVARQQVDLTRQRTTEQWFHEARPDAVILAAGRVGGIHANVSLPAEFISDNIAIALNVISAAHAVGVRKLLFLGSSCIYPRLAVQPMTESQLLTGPLEPTNQWYAIAKIAGIKLCQAYRRQYNDSPRRPAVQPARLHCAARQIRRADNGAGKASGAGPRRTQGHRVRPVCREYILMFV